MFHRLPIARLSAAALVCLAMLNGPSFASEPLDTSQLPGIAGARQIFASPQSTIYASQEDLETTARTVVDALTAAGWLVYTSPFARQVEREGMHLFTLKRGPHGVSVMVQRAPAQGDAVSVNYTAMPLPNDLPIPDDAADIKYDPHRPHLEALTGKSIEAAVAFTRSGLAALGYAPHVAPEGTPEPKLEGPGHLAYFVAERKRPLLLMVRPAEDGRTAIRIERVPPSLLPGASPRREAPPPKTAEQTPQRSTHDAIERQISELVGTILKEATKPSAPGAATTREHEAPVPRLRPKADQTAPIPLPETADALDIDETTGAVTFSSASSVRALAEFYRAAMAEAGWVAEPSVINRPNMAVLSLSRNQTPLTITILQQGTVARVRAEGEALMAAAAAKTREPAPASASASQPAADPALTAEDAAGLPVPAPNTSRGYTQALFRVEARARVPASVAAVLAFYRAELGKRGWTELPGAAVQDEAARLTFTSREGPAVLTLGRDGEATSVELVLRKEAEARQAGKMPQPGQGMLMFANVLEVEATLVIGKRTIKLAPGEGEQTTDAPKLQVRPGTHKITLRRRGEPPRTEPVTVGPNEIWGILVGPGGVLPLQMY